MEIAGRVRSLNDWHDEVNEQLTRIEEDIEGIRGALPEQYIPRRELDTRLRLIHLSAITAAATGVLKTLGDIARSVMGG